MLQHFLLYNLVTIIFAWTPIGSIYNLPEISSVKVADKDYVVWKNFTQKFTVQDDICPHRLAPLSEGRIVGNKLECGYHGWKFNSAGRCCIIPQEDQHFALPNTCNVNTYPVKVSGDILWACLDKRLAKKFGIVQEDEVLMNCDVPYIREVPYSWNFLLENFFDPAHIPFAHHGLQSFRYDAGAIPIELEKFDKKGVVLNFRDVTAGTKRHGKIVYKGPFIYKLFKKKIPTSPWINDLTILCVPITTGRSRVFMCYDKRNALSYSNGGDAAQIVKFRKNAHVMSNKFFNTDDYLVHKQEINKAKGRSYNMRPKSDYGVQAIRRWIEKYHSPWNYQNTLEITKEQALDNYNNHIKFCKDCNPNMPP